MINRNSPAYKAGRLVGKLLFISLGYIVGRRWGRKPIEKSFPEIPEKKK